MLQVYRFAVLTAHYCSGLFPAHTDMGLPRSYGVTSTHMQGVAWFARPT